MIPTIDQALRVLGLTLSDIHHYSGEKDTLIVVTNDARKFRVTQAEVKMIIQFDSEAAAAPPEERPKPRRKKAV